ncbi:hypothetical protein H0H81_005826 [Sphagnurus paluster]|uniref:Leucine-rich repeat-containing protein 40 n=1 Tax=Sphagnurus paluster TaxID=117069 RepID=A0A9P7GMW6_9AGAR|nr:hypothetical protein H0H81_005826 [Sphagnurus paluster]
MSRIPPPSSSRTPVKPPTTPSKSRGTVTTSRLRPQSTRSSTPTKPSAAKPVINTTENLENSRQNLSIKEAIALRRAEAKKAQLKTNTGGLSDFIPTVEDASSASTSRQEEEDILGRWSVRETIDRARSTALFEVHLGITPDPLKSVPDEPVLPPSAPSEAPRRGGKKDNPAWFEAQDLTILKIWNNEIEEVQHEISLFGSLKIVDLHKNNLVSLPQSFGDLTSLTTLDLSHNALTSLPSNIFALPELTTLNLSHNSLTTLHFNEPFTSGNTKAKRLPSGNFFTPSIKRAASPLPRLLLLDASYNKICAKDIDLVIPQNLTKIDLSSNPLGIDEPQCQYLLQALGNLPRLKELRFDNAEIGDDSLPSTLFSSPPFPSIRILDFGQTKVTPEAVKEAFKIMKQEISYDITTEDPPEGVARIIVGKKVVKEAWELELERRETARRAKHAGFVDDDWDAMPKSSPAPASSKTESAKQPALPMKPREIVKEAWEIEAEQGLLTEGGKRRARAAAAAAANGSKPEPGLGLGKPSPSPNHSPKSSTSGFSLSSSQYYSQATQTLTLPPSSPPTKSPAHARAFSLAAPTSSSALSLRNDIAVPAPSLPLSIIATQPFAQTLKILILINRRMDKSFSLPSSASSHGGCLPNLEELNLEGCGFADLVPVTRSDPDSGTATPPRSSEMILPLISKLFPSLRTLNLSHNALTSASLTAEALSGLILSAEGRRGLKHLRLRGNAITELDGFLGLAESFKGNRQVPEWHLDELDIRDNEIGKLPPELGLLPMDVFLVDGNV